MASKLAPVPSPDWTAPRLAGKTFVFGNVPPWKKDEYRRLIEGEGGAVVENVTDRLDFLLFEGTHPSPPKARTAERLNARGAAIRCIDAAQFFALFAPAVDEAAAMLRGGQKGVRRWNALRCIPRPDEEQLRLGLNWDPLSEKSPVRMPRLGAIDLRRAVLRGACFSEVNFNGADLRRADLTGARLGGVKDSRFDGARDCDFRGARLEGVEFFGAMVNMVFRKACLAKSSPRATIFSGCDFTGADLRGTQGVGARWSGANLAGANLEKAVLSKGDLSGARLTKARLAGADLARARLVRADLSGADLRGANLADADLTEAVVVGADFTGANLVGAKLPAEVRKAKGLEPARQHGAAVGPNLHALNEFARSAEQTKTTIVLERGEERVLLEAEWSRPKGYPGRVTVEHYQGTRTGTDWQFDHPATLSAGILALARKFAGATPWLASLTLECNRRPRGTDLWKMAAAAWCEAFGLDVPAAEDLERQRQGGDALRHRLRLEFLGDLRGGPRGVARWNGHSYLIGQLVKTFPGADLTGARLAGADFTDLDFPAAKFDGANLSKSSVTRCDFRSASFRNARLERCVWWPAECAGADFSGADLRRARLEYSGFEKANFQDADLRGATFNSCGLEGANLSGARLDGADFEGSRYDEQTRFPPGTSPPEGLVYQGGRKSGQDSSSR